MDNNAKVDGENVMLKKMIFQDFVRLALKKIKKKILELRKTLILINCLIAKDLVNKKI